MEGNDEVQHAAEKALRVMAQPSSIEWTDATWNPVTGCTKISPGCKHCYAEVFAERFRGVRGHPYEQGFDLRLWPERLEAPLRWKAPRMIFVNSMSDLFHERVSSEFIASVFQTMVRARQHTFQVLTKRASRLAEWHRENRTFWGTPNVWLGVSVEDRHYGVPRIDLLRSVRSAVRFLSVEPLLEDLGPLDLTGIDWVIVGGESGRGARPMQPEWVRSVHEQCTSAGIPFFFKQWGGRWKNRTGRVFDGRTWDEMPIRPLSRDQRDQDVSEQLSLS
jgi:protein gp37